MRAGKTLAEAKDADKQAVHGERYMWSGIRWSAILAGVVVGISLQTFLGFLGLATGLSFMSSQQSDPTGFGSMLWTVISLFISAYVGGFLAVRLSASRRRSDGVMYGVVTWAVAMLLFTMMLTTTAGTILNGLYSIANTTVVTTESTAKMSPELVSQLQKELGRELNQSDMEQLEAYMLEGQRDEAVNYLTAQGIGPERASAIVTSTMNRISDSTYMVAEPLISSRQIMRVMVATAWMVFLGVTVSLFASICGGLMGTRYSVRQIWEKPGFGQPATQSGSAD